MKIAIVYKSRREYYRIKKLKQRLCRAADGIMQAAFVVSVAGAFIFACGMDSENISPVLRGFAACVTLACLTYAGIKTEKKTGEKKQR